MPEDILLNSRDPCKWLALVPSIIANFQSRMGIHEAAEYIGVHDCEIREAMDSGKLRYYTVGKTGRRTSPAYLAEYIARHKMRRNEPLPK